MKKRCNFLMACLLVSLQLPAQSKYWVGPAVGNWSDGANWSNAATGSGNDGTPGMTDNVYFMRGAVVHMDVSPVINSLNVSPVGETLKLYAAKPTVLRINLSFQARVWFSRTAIVKASKSLAL